ncbi:MULTISPECIES: pyridoxal-dependent decarboxylase [unclassified Amycolatopsis]|uniref:pyridoxal phosphate-dependent decarboxylase family protein n=1 Tax=unclassified Amycolatopsis TaxID=2618356 RepID=UPI0014303193|nr:MULTISPECIES: pyridoxal-dependent decarboxylase [unclassified Amycolatopsis]
MNLTDPRAAAHLQPPPLCVAVAADAMASATNASVDTFDSGPSAIAAESWVVEVLARLAGLGREASGVLTPGGSLSNLMAVLLARDRFAGQRGLDVRRDGTRALGRPVVLCSELAHFSVRRACATLGLGTDAVRSVKVDGARQMDAAGVSRALGRLSQDAVPLAIVATAGTTDFGSIDRLPEIAAVAKAHRIWLHVDAAYGFGALFSPRLSRLLDGIGSADSITADLHKFGWQPAPASLLLVRRRADLASFREEVAYLNPADDLQAGYLGLLGHSLQTTRRADALKIAATLLSYGSTELGRMVEACCDLAKYAARAVAADHRLELVAPAELGSVVFRYLPAQPALADEVNAVLRRELMRAGTQLLGRTSARLESSGVHQICLKLTFVNPIAGFDDVDQLIEATCVAGYAAEQLLSAQNEGS